MCEKCAFVPGPGRLEASKASEAFDSLVRAAQIVGVPEDDQHSQAYRALDAMVDARDASEAKEQAA